MKLLFDQNLSPRLVTRLVDLYPDSAHVNALGLGTASDSEVWEHAKEGHFIIVSKDEDFNDLSLVRGCPPKLIWSQLGNCTTDRVETVLRAQYSAIEAFNADPRLGTFVLR